MPTGPLPTPQNPQPLPDPPCRPPLIKVDPTTEQDYPCYYWGYYVWNNLNGAGPVEGRIYWPNDCGSTVDPPGRLPMAR